MAVNTWSFTNIQQVELTGLPGSKSWTAIAPATAHGSAILTDNQDGSADGDVIPGATASLTASGYSLSGSIVTLQGTTSGGDALIATGGNFYMLQSAAPSWTAAYPANTITGADLFCFEKTTFILTPDGEVQVSELKIGDEILNAANEAVKIEWIGHQKKHPLLAKLNQALPIKILKGAFDDQKPNRDLLLSPGHALFIDDILVNAKALINGLSIYAMFADEYFEDIEYYHIETKNHEIIIANGVPAETYIDKKSREAFDNYSEFLKLFPDGKQAVELDIPRAHFARQVSSFTKNRLKKRALKIIKPRLAA